MTLRDDDSETWQVLRIRVRPVLLETLRIRAERRGITVTEWLRRAVVTQMHLEDEDDRSN